MVSVCLLGVCLLNFKKKKKKIAGFQKFQNESMFQHILSNFFFWPPLREKFARISKISKREHVSANSEQLFFFDPPHGKNLVGFQKFQNESMFQQILSNFFFFSGVPPLPGYCEVLLVVPRSTGNPLMDLMSVPDNNAWSRVDYFIISYVQYSQVDMNP